MNSNLRIPIYLQPNGVIFDIVLEIYKDYESDFLTKTHVHSGP